MKIYETLENGIKIVEYEESLAATLADMWNKSADDWGGDNDVKTPGQVAARTAGAAHYNVYVALDGDEAVGYCSLERYWADADTLYIDLLGVRPDYQGKGVGKALVQICTRRTIELGYPRIDLHTWPGNTNAVPLYKKCGYLWEDRPDSTHLVNFIPTILKTQLFADFFKKADWYADSTRSLEILPDGVKVNDFEVFGYSWEKDGESLAIGFERAGRQMRLIETNDYKIEFMAQDHRLAFGLNYECAFKIENKTGKALHIKIAGREDKNIKFDFTLDADITGVQEYKSQFYVGAIDEPQNKWRVFPCVLADVEINGSPVTFGLGIESKFPLTVALVDENKIQQVGLETDMHISIRSALLQDAEIKFELPESKLVALKEKHFTVKIPAGGKTSVIVAAKFKEIGYEALPVTYDVKLADGTQFSFNKPIHFRTQDLAHSFHYETDTSYGLISGPWRLNFTKSDNEAETTHLINKGYENEWFSNLPPKLGKPYDDEFNLIKSTVKMHQNGANMVLEAEYVSEKFSGMVVTQIYTLNASGILTRRSKVHNRGKKAREIMLSDIYGFLLGNNTIFRYKGQFTQNHSTPYPDGPHDGMDSIDPDGLEENWVFEDDPSSPKGFCWPTGMKPLFQWGSDASFEIDCGKLEPGQIFETQPVVYVYGLFDNFRDFRNYAMQINDRKDSVPARRVEVRLNNYNPFLYGDSLALDILNNRETVLEGSITVSSTENDIFTSQTQVNPPEEPTESNNFALKLNREPLEMEFVKVDMNLASYVKSYNRVIFAPIGEITRAQEEASLVVSNGKITFKADPKYGHVCYSLKTPDGNEWLFNQHPEHKPFAWWNPFLGGIRLLPPKMNNINVLKEQITADFTEVTDNHGNKWQGIRTTLTFSKDDELKGAVYESYYVTLPGLPLLCAFYRFINGTGVYRDDVLMMGAFLNPSENLKDVYVEAVDKNQQKSLLHFGSGELCIEFENIVKISGARPQKIYAFHGNKNNGKSNEVDGDNKHNACVNVYMDVHAAPGKTFTSSPMFLLITEQDIPEGALDDLERVTFDENIVR